jgi:CheY-like chemotaxis protein
MPGALPARSHPQVATIETTNHAIPMNPGTISPPCHRTDSWDRRGGSPGADGKSGGIIDKVLNFGRVRTGRRLISSVPAGVEAAGSGQGDRAERQIATAGCLVPMPDPRAVPKAVPHRILIADDDSFVRGSLAAVLEYEGFVVDEARDGIQTIGRALEHLPDLILLDLNLPRWDDWAGFRRLNRALSMVPVIAITARTHLSGRAAQLGVDAFLEKPLNIPALIRAINDLTCE